MLKLSIYCDGSCRGNGYQNSTGGWGYFFLIHNNNDSNDTVESCGKQVINTTNNKMELTAAIQGCIHALEYAKENNIKDWICEVYTDSAYIHNCMTQKWYINWQRNGWKNAKKEPVKNRELWEQLIPFFINEHFKFLKVKGHNNNYWNEKADKLARGLIE